MRPNRSTSIAERVDVAQPRGVAVPGHHRAQQLRGSGPPVHPKVLGLGVLTLGLGGVEPALAPLGAVHLQLGGHHAQRVGDLVVAFARARRRAAAPHRGRRRRHPVRSAASSPPRSATSPVARRALSMSASALTRSSSSLAVARCCASRSRRDGQLGRNRPSVSRARRLPGLPSPPAVSPPPRRPCGASRSRAMACWCAAVAASSSARALPDRSVLERRAARVDASTVTKLGEPASAVRRRRRHRCSAVARRGQPVPVAGQLPAPLIEGARGRDVVDPCRRQRTRQNLLRGIEFCLESAAGGARAPHARSARRAPRSRSVVVALDDQ